jgi:hypothetical protein
MMSTWKEMRRMSIKKKLKKVKTSRYLMGQDSELATHGVEVMEEESGPSKNVFENHMVPKEKSSEITTND